MMADSSSALRGVPCASVWATDAKPRQWGHLPYMEGVTLPAFGWALGSEFGRTEGRLGSCVLFGSPVHVCMYAVWVWCDPVDAVRIEGAAKSCCAD